MAFPATLRAKATPSSDDFRCLTNRHLYATAGELKADERDK
jgi:hypothetical protein